MQCRKGKASNPRGVFNAVVRSMSVPPVPLRATKYTQSNNTIFRQHPRQPCLFHVFTSPSSCSHITPHHPNLTAVLGTLAAISTAFASLFADEAAAQHRETRAQTSAVFLLLLLRWRALRVSALALWWVVHLLLRWRTAVLLLRGVAALGWAVAKHVSEEIIMYIFRRASRASGA